MSSSIIASIQPAKTRAQVYSNHHCGEKKGREEKAYECVTEGEHGLFRIMHEGKEALITLTRYKDDAEQKLEQLFKGKSKEQERSIPRPNLTVNLPQLSLPTFNGEPRQWRQFWSSFNAAVHSQTIPEIQKLNYLFSCLRGNASQVVSGYEIAPENYEVIRRLLKNKYGDPSTITTILYNELQAIKRNEKEWMTTIENIERVLRQLEAIGENLEHSSIETTIESKLPSWVLNKIYTQKKVEVPWSISKLRDFLSDIVHVTQQVKNSQNPSTFMDTKLTIDKLGQKPRYNPRGTSALSMLRSNSKPLSFAVRNQHSSQLTDYHENLQIPPKMDYSASLYNSTNTTRTNTTKETLLLCKEVKVFNPTQPQRQKKALALFDIGSQLSFISQKLSQQLKLAESDKQIMKITPFGMRNPTLCPTASTQLNVQTMENDVIRLHVNVVEHLTNELKVVDTPREIQFQELTNHWKKPDILIGADHFFKFIKLQNVPELSSGHMLVQSKVGPMIAGSGDTTRKKRYINITEPKKSSGKRQ
uniref:DUF1758 domain-containing protein n=1 Tax=Loa loa TaxID=7209 RepID=A0A1I7V7G7_LOALO